MLSENYNFQLLANFLSAECRYLLDFQFMILGIFSKKFKILSLHRNLKTVSKVKIKQIYILLSIFIQVGYFGIRRYTLQYISKNAPITSTAHEKHHISQSYNTRTRPE